MAWGVPTERRPFFDPGMKKVCPEPCGRGCLGCSEGRKWLLRSGLCPAAARGPARHRRPLTALLLEVQSAKSEEEGGVGGGDSAVAQEGNLLHARRQAAAEESTVAVCFGQGGLRESP